MFVFRFSRSLKKKEKETLIRFDLIGLRNKNEPRKPEDTVFFFFVFLTFCFIKFENGGILNGARAKPNPSHIPNVILGLNY